MDFTQEAIDCLSCADILKDDVFLSLLEIADPVKYERTFQALEKRAAELRTKTEFKKTLKAFKEKEKNYNKSEVKHELTKQGTVPLKFDGGKNPQLTIENFLSILENDPLLKDYLLYNELSNAPECISSGEIRRWKDEDDSWLRGYIEQNYCIYSPQKLDDALRVRFNQRRYHPVREKIQSITWDGKPRIKRFLIEWLKVDDCPYSEEVSRLIFAGGIHRAFRPGCKFEDMAVLIGKKQGEGKSTIIRWLAMDDKFFREVNEIDGQRGVEAVEGGWICEVSELLALKRTKEVEAAKSYFSRQTDTYRKPYDKRVTENPRQCIFIGTTNTAEFLTDKTGNRRYYPVECNSSGRDLFDHKAEIQEYIEQCWAEAYALYQKGELPPVLDKSILPEAQYRQECALEDDYRAGMIKAYLDDKAEGESVCIIELWQQALGESFKPTRKDSNELALIMQGAPGWIKVPSVQRTSRWGVQRCWVKQVSSKNLGSDLPF